MMEQADLHGKRITQGQIGLTFPSFLCAVSPFSFLLDEPVFHPRHIPTDIGPFPAAITKCQRLGHVQRKEVDLLPVLEAGKLRAQQQHLAGGQGRGNTAGAARTS